MPARTWTSEELTTMESAEELRIASRRRDGTLRKPVTVWMVRHGSDVYIRAVKGRAGPWFRGVQHRHQGHVRVGDVGRDVTFVDVAGLDEELDTAYRTKYRRYAGAILDSVLTPQARAATLRINPSDDPS